MRSSLGISAIAIAATILAAAPAGALSINLGDNGGTTATVNSAGTSGGILGTNLLGGSNGDTNARVDLGGTSNGQLLDLFGDGSGQPTTASVNLDGGGGTDGNVLLDLFGSGTGDDAAVTLGGDRNTAFAAPSNSNAAFDLFGPGGNENGGSGDGGTPGTGGPSGQQGIVTGSIQLASIDTSVNANCFTPNATQAAKLVSRHTYDATTFAAWGQVGSVKVVDVGLCDGAGAGITSEGNIARLQAMIAARPALRDSLGKLGRTPGEVVGADKSGQTLTVYVM